MHACGVGGENPAENTGGQIQLVPPAVGVTVLACRGWVHGAVSWAWTSCRLGTFVVATEIEDEDQPQCINGEVQTSFVGSI